MQLAPRHALDSWSRCGEHFRLSRSSRCKAPPSSCNQEAMCDHALQVAIATGKRRIVAVCRRSLAAIDCAV